MSHYILICNEATTAESSKSYALGLEEKCARSDARIAELEAKLKEKEEELSKKEEEAEAILRTRNKLATEYNHEKREHQKK